MILKRMIIGVGGKNVLELSTFSLYSDDNDMQSTFSNAQELDYKSLLRFCDNEYFYTLK